MEILQNCLLDISPHDFTGLIDWEVCHPKRLQCENSIWRIPAPQTLLDVMDNVFLCLAV